ncbi:hypothetical protein KFL_000160500 [Klebsormidium nitens]|uniref:Uncharacterized protein n=1 Tax=Klebsormidium nitens TaxID=105231 RepID=A0A1Y1HPZ5_KLENI|nr:hypothetical protein KFL_000160500 [Klebsormidium nitens]|eukprot:GAQ78647.1 hypothetical protein KFL_000160500 [Klebsormidium nitens]
MEATGKTTLRPWMLETSWLAVILFCLFLAGVQVGAVQHDTRVKTLVETSYVLGALPPAYGNLTLPEPTPINEYLRTNTTLKNYLLPSDPPLQLIKAQYIDIGEMLVSVFIISIFVGLIVSLVLTGNWSENVDELRSFNLPDPDTKINPLLQANNISLSLHRCKATRRRDGGSERPLFQFYIGMPKGMCAQILAAGSPYGEYLSADPQTWNDDKGEIPFKTFVSAFATLSFTPILLFEVIYLACFVS